MDRITYAFHPLGFSLERVILCDHDSNVSRGIGHICWTQGRWLATAYDHTCLGRFRGKQAAARAMHRHLGGRPPSDFPKFHTRHL